MRAEKDIIVRDLAGVERFVAFGADVPASWEYVRDADPAVVPASQTAAGVRGNPDAVAHHAETLRARADRIAAGGAQPADLEGMTVEDLQAEADRRGLEVTGTGSGGNVVKGDLVKALRADDAAGA
jgi:hypothetical protein